MMDTIRRGSRDDRAYPDYHSLSPGTSRCLGCAWIRYAISCMKSTYWIEKNLYPQKVSSRSVWAIIWLRYADECWLRRLSNGAQNGYIHFSWYRSRHQFDDGLVLVTDLNPQSVRGLWILMLHLEWALKDIWHCVVYLMTQLKYGNLSRVPLNIHPFLLHWRPPFTTLTPPVYYTYTPPK